MKTFTFSECIELVAKQYHDKFLLGFTSQDDYSEPEILIFDSKQKMLNQIFSLIDDFDDWEYGHNCLTKQDGEYLTTLYFDNCYINDIKNSLM